MKSRQLGNRLLVTMILVCCSQQIWAGIMVKGRKAKNSTTTSQTIKQPKGKATTTVKPESETTTLPGDFDLLRRSAFINNQHIEDTKESLPDTIPPLNQLLQQDMQSVFSNKEDNLQGYSNDATQIKENLDVFQKPPENHNFGYEMGQFDDYDEEETSEYGSENDYTPENCEDTQESLGDNDGSYVGAAQLTHSNSESNTFEHSGQNKPYDSANYGSEITVKPGTLHGLQTITNHVLSSVNNVPQNDYSSTKPSQQHLHINNKPIIKPKPISQSQQLPTNQYIQSKPLELYDHNDNNQKPITYSMPFANDQTPLTNLMSYENPKLQQNSHFNSEKTPQHLYSNQNPVGNNKPATQQQTKQIYSKPGQNTNRIPFYNTNYPSTTITPTAHQNSYNNLDSISSTNGNSNSSTTSSYNSGSSNSLNPALMPKFSYGNSNTPFSSPSGHYKYPENGQKRHLTFRTISSSTQYLSSPLADLMIKFSIGMAKPSNSKEGNNFAHNQSQILNVLNDDDIDEKTE